MSASDLRNLTFIGHSDAGKTSLVEALAHHYGATTRLGTINEGNTICDFNDSEREKKHSLGAAVVHLDKQNLNLIDTPGYPDFLADAVTSLGAAGCAVVTLSAKNDGFPFHGVRMWEMAGELGLARAVVLTKVDHENLDLNSIIDNLHEKLGFQVVPFTLPDQVGPGFSSVKTVASDENPYRSQLVDAIVEADDDLMERYLEEGDVSDEELAKALPHAMAKGTLAPLFFVDPIRGIGVSELADFIVEEFPTAANQLSVVKGDNVEGGSPDERLVARVWKVMSDKHLGQISYIRVLQGTMKSDMQVPSPQGGKPFKLSGLSTIFGKDVHPISSAGPGEIVAVTRLDDLQIGNTIVSEGEGKDFEFPLPTPYTSVAVRPKSRDDEQKIGPELHKIAKEDPTFSVRRDSVTHELVVSGLSDLHLNEMLGLLHHRGVDCETTLPRIAYQETVTSNADGHHRHKKQSGGSGQFGECYIRLRPNDRGAGFEFLDKIVGGSIPRQFIPAVEKGMREQMEKGIIAGSQVVDLVVELYDGKHHDVDSDEVSFKMAGARALKGAFESARPILLEPVMHASISVPSRYFGDVSGDLNNRRGQILGMDSKGDMQIIEANAPLAELQSYSTPLRSMTHGEGSFTMEFAHYDQVPSHIQDKIVAALGEKEEE
ncbi:MAG: elongation factor G [Planctomycetota bacterium]|jgi:elongation factor G|nr:elongation factor G [Planctomycetota bacterium]